MADIGIAPAQTEVLVPGLQYGLQNQASMLTGRREVQIASQPGFYDPASSRLIRIHVADGSSWWQMGTTKLVFENRDLISLYIFRSHYLSLRITIYQIENHELLIITINQYVLFLTVITY